MKNPKLIVKPFAKNGQKNVIPENYETSMDSNQATWDQGFGQITMLPVAAGGLPPKGQDFNGILNQISESIVYQSQGGRFKFSPEYAESIGGYPKGAILQSDDEKKEYQSLIDNNKVNFNTESNISASWELVGAKYAIKTEVDLALLKKFDKENISGILGNDNSKVPSLNLLTNEVGKLQPKGNYAPAGDYATKDELKTGLDSKLGKDAIVQYGGANEDVVMSQKAVTDAIKEKPDITQTTGASTTLVMSQNSVTELAAKKVDKLNAEVNNALSIKSSGEYASVKLEKNSGESFSIETVPDSLDDAAKFFYKRVGGSEVFTVSLRKKSGVIALVSDIPSSVTKVEDVTSQREAGVTYVNSNSHTIFVMLESYGSVSQASIFTLDGVSMTWITSGAQYGNVTSATIPVPAGSSYSSGEFKKWVEIS
ncbi:TPA: hypothetical protein ACS777_001867 [Providencia alcalifaciens]